MEHTLLLFLLEIAAKATTIMAVTALVCRLLRRASAALRHFVWVIALAGVLALPALALLMPAWRVAVLPAAHAGAAMVVRQAEARPAGATADASSIANPAVPIVEARPQQSRSALARPSARPIADRAIPDRPNVNSRPSIPETADRRTIAFLVLALWIAGAAVALVRFVAGHAHLWWMERHADPIRDPAWLELARRVAHQLRLAVHDEDGTARRPAVRLLRCGRRTMPVCWGVRRPSLLLPSDADSWTVERRRIVLLHELAHAKRRDCLTQAIAQIAIVVHWFNPLVWLAVRRLRAERELACDDIVLASGASAPDYADHLLDIARAFRTAGCPSWAAVAMARPSQLEGRLLAILDRHRDRRPPTPNACAAGAVLALAMVGTLAAVQTAPAPGASDTRPPDRAVSRNRARATPAVAAPQAPVAARDAEVAPVPSRPRRIAPNTEELHPIDDLDPIDIERSAMDAARAADSAAIAAQAAETAAARIAGADDRSEADPKIVAALITALKDQSAEVRREAASTLASVQSPQALEALIAATTDADKDVRAFAVRAISRHRSDAVAQALARALKDNDAGVRRSAMRGVARLRDPKYLDVFVEALKSGDPEVRMLAANALGQIGDARAVDPLIGALKDAEDGVREMAVYALGQIGRRAGARERR